MGFLDGVGGVLTGLGERAHEQNLINMQQQVNMHNQLRADLKSIIDDPSMPRDAVEAAQQKWFQMSAIPAHKFKPKDAEAIQQFVGQATIAARRAQRMQLTTPPVMPGTEPAIPAGPPALPGPPEATAPLPAAPTPQWLPTGEAPGTPAFVVEPPTPPFTPPPTAGAGGAAAAVSTPTVLASPTPPPPPPGTAPEGIPSWMSDKQAIAMATMRMQSAEARRAEEAKLDVEAKAQLKKLTDLAKEYEKTGMEPGRALLAAQGHSPQPRLVISPFDGSVWDAVSGKEIKAAPGGIGRYNSQMVAIRVPGQPDTTAFSDPRHPGTFYSQTGELIELPEGAQVVPYSIVASENRGMLYGEFGSLYREGLGRGLSKEAAMQYAAREQFRKRQISLSAVEQRMAIAGELSGIGGGAGVPPPPPPPSVVGAPAPSAAPPQPRGGAATRSAAQTGPPAAEGPKILTPKERNYVNQYFGALLGTMPGSRSQAAQVGVKRGRELVIAMSGLDPATFGAMEVENKGAVKQLSETIQRQGAIQRLSNTIELHGKVLEDTAKAIKDTGSPLFNRPVREWSRKFAGSPELKRFQIARNAVQREYTYLTAGGAQSRAMLPVSTEAHIDKILSDDSTMAEVLAETSQMGIEAQRELEAMRKTRADITTDIQSGKLGKAVGAPIPPPATGAPKTAEEYLRSRGIR